MSRYRLEPSLLTTYRGITAAQCFFKRAIDLQDLPTSIMVDKSDASSAGVSYLGAKSATAIKLWQSKYLNKTVEHDHKQPNHVCCSAVHSLAS